MTRSKHPLSDKKQFESFIDDILADRWDLISQKTTGLEEHVPKLLDDVWVKATLARLKLEIPDSNEKFDSGWIWAFVLLGIWRQQFSRFGKMERKAIDLLAFFARYAWPCYLSVNSKLESQRIDIKTDQEMGKWLSQTPRLKDALHNFDLQLDSAISSKLKNWTERDNSTLARARDRGMSVIHIAFCDAVNIEVLNSDGSQPRASRKKQKTILATQQTNDWKTSTDFPPILSMYWQFPENVESASQLRQRLDRLPRLGEITDLLLSEKIAGLSLTADQRILALELINYLPYWAITESGDLASSISRRRLEAIWNSIHKENVSPIIGQLVDAGLLMVDTGSNLFMPNLLLFDALFMRVWLQEHKKERNELPPTEANLTLSRWLYLLIDHLIDRKDYRGAGDYLWRVQGLLPGASSRSWLQILYIIWSAPAEALMEPRIWALATIAEQVFQRLAAINGTADLWIMTNSLPVRLPLSPEGDQAQMMRDIVSDYLSGLSEYIDLHANLLDYVSYVREMLDIQFGVDRPGKSRFSVSLSIAYSPDRYEDIDWLYYHLVSGIRSFDPHMKIKTTDFFFGNNAQTVEESFIRAFMPDLSNVSDIKAFYVEPLVAWKSPVVDRYLNAFASRKFLLNAKAFAENSPLHNRIAILKHAMAGTVGYEDWV